MIWFTSDTHASHSNITRGVTKWGITKEDVFYPDIVNTRDFDTVELMTQAVIDSINKYVMEDDTLYHLGDWSFGGIDKIWEFRKQIKCKNIHLICGNHDEHIKKNKPRETKWIRWYNGPIDQWYEWKDNFKTEKECLEACSKESFYEPHQYNFNYPQKLFTTVQNYLELKIDKKNVVLSHFPIQEWYEMDRGSIHLHGHCHHKLDFDDINMYHRRMDVGIDWEEFRPYSWEEILEIMSKKQTKKHNS